MLARFGCIACLLLSPAATPQAPAPGAQTGPPPVLSQDAQQTPPTHAPEIRTGTQLVVIDVVVEDSTGHPVHNLPRNAFHVTEGKAPQAVSNFEEHSTTSPPQPGPALPKLPPGTFTDYTPVPPNGALNILLIDALNTPMADQAFLRSQLKDYVNRLQPGTRIAIFGLNTRLYLLQGFTSDLDTLKDAVNHKLIPRSSNLMDNAVDGSADTSMSENAADAGLAEIASNLQQMEAVQQSFQLQLRAQYTLDAFNDLGHYLSAFPGRKNLLWFSGSFPIDVYPDATLSDPFSVLQLNDVEFRDTTKLLTRSQVAVFPIDARGLMVAPMFNASNAGHQYARNPQAFGNDLAKFNSSQAQEHMTMEQMASDTGGRAYYNTNGLAAAAASALEAGSNYYTLAYAPTDRNPHGEYRSIHLQLDGPQAAAGLKLFYRHGYYADDPRRDPSPAQTAAASTTKAAKAAAPPAPSVPDPAMTAAAAYSRAAMLHGAPTPQDLLFKVRVLPISPTSDATLIAEDEPNPSGPFKGPYRRYNVDFAALGSQIRLTSQPNGEHTGAVEFQTFVYDSDGKLLNMNSKTVQMKLPPETYKRFVGSGIGMHMAISAPARGESFLRIAVHDLSSNHYGVVEVPASSVSKLAPPPPPPSPTPASGAPAAPGAAPQPAVPPPAATKHPSSAPPPETTTPK